MKFRKMITVSIATLMLVGVGANINVGISNVHASRVSSLITRRNSYYRKANYYSRRSKNYTKRARALNDEIKGLQHRHASRSIKLENLNVYRMNNAQGYKFGERYNYVSNSRIINNHISEMMDYLVMHNSGYRKADEQAIYYNTYRTTRNSRSESRKIARGIIKGQMHLFNASHVGVNMHSPLG